MNILGIGRAVPEQAITNAQLEQILDTSDEWIKRRTGIQERRVMSSQNLTALAVEAAREALADAGVAGGELDLVLVATTLGDYLFPSLSCLLLKEIGASCPAMDLHAACTGFLYSLQTADAFLTSGKASRVLVVGAEAISRMANWKDRSTCVLFGDGAGAVVLGPGEGLLSIHLHAQTDQELLFAHSPQGNCPYTRMEDWDAEAGLTMSGQDVFRFAVSQSEKDLRTAVDEAGLTFEQIDWVLLHQANRRIIDAVARRLGAAPGHVPSNIHRMGNTSSASIPLLMYDLYHAGLLEPGHLLALSGFGSGMTSGACVIRWDKPKPAELQDPAHTLHFT